MREFLEALLKQYLDILKSDVGSILLTDKNSQDIVVRVARGKNISSILGQRVRIGEGISGFVAQTKKPLLVEDVRMEKEIKTLCRTENYRTHSFLSVPLMHSGRLLGVVNITERENGLPFSIKELSFVSALSMCAAQSIDKIIYCEHLEKQLECFKNSTAVSKFTSTIAHELNNPLDGVLRYTQLCMSHTPEHGIVREYLFEIQSGLKRMAGIIHSMFEFSFAGDRNCGPLSREEVSINDILKKTVAYFNHYLCLKGMEIKTEVAENLPLIKDYGLEQVFANCIKNAIEAIEGDGKLIIKAYLSGGCICVEFIDSGKGIDANLKDEIFEPFFTTKHRGKGLGLAIAKEIVDCYKGKIEVENIPGLGAKFAIFIPIGGEL